MTKKLLMWPCSATIIFSRPIYIVMRFCSVLREKGVILCGCKATYLQSRINTGLTPDRVVRLSVIVVAFPPWVPPSLRPFLSVQIEFDTSLCYVTVLEYASGRRDRGGGGGL